MTWAKLRLRKMFCPKCRAIIHGSAPTDPCPSCRGSLQEMPEGRGATQKARELMFTESSHARQIRPSGYGITPMNSDHSGGKVRCHRPGYQ